MGQQGVTCWAALEQEFGRERPGWTLAVLLVERVEHLPIASFESLQMEQGLSTLVALQEVKRGLDFGSEHFGWLQMEHPYCVLAGELD